MSKKTTGRRTTPRAKSMVAALIERFARRRQTSAPDSSKDSFSGVFGTLSSSEKSEDLTLGQMVKVYGWIAFFYPEDKDHIHGSVWSTQDIRKNIEAERLVCLATLGWMKERHPDPEISDKAAELIVLMGGYTRETDYYYTTRPSKE